LKSIVWGDVDKYITQAFGCTPLLVEPWWNIADCRWHCGVDIGDMPIGTPLFAARAGRIVSVGWGQLGLAAAGTNQIDWYIHIDRAATAVGHNVARGELIAYSGNKVPSGGATTGPHLHFEVQTAPSPYYNRPATSVDPVPILAPTFGPGGGTLGDEMTAEQAAAAIDLLQRIFNLLMVGYHTSTPTTDGYLKKTVKPELDQILAKLVTVDNAAILAAIADLKAHPAVVSDPTLSTKIDALSKHLGVGIP